jgi:hypothetical protein
MTERRPWLWRLAPAALVLLLAAALVAGPSSTEELANPSAATGDLAGVLDRVREEALVLVGFDPDIGTYAEVRPTVRALLADLVERGARLAFVSLTPEGRALAIAERARMVRAGVEPDRLVDLGFVPGAEAALVALARALDDPTPGGMEAGLVAPIAAEEVSLAVIVGGNDLGPRSWVEQLRPRVEALQLVAVAPSVLLPELQPYLASGQLDALLATPRDGAAYRATLDRGGPAATLAGDPGPSTLAILVGMLAAIAALGAGVGARLADALRLARTREAP